MSSILLAAAMTSLSAGRTVCDDVVSASGDTAIGVLPSPDRTAALAGHTGLPKRLSAADLASNKSSPSSILKRRLSHSSPRSESADSHIPSPKPGRAVVSLPAALHSRVIDALTSLHRHQHLHQSPPPLDVSMSSASFAFTHTSPRLSRSISASAVEDEVSPSLAAEVEEIGECDKVGDLPVFITNFHDERHSASHHSAAAPHIQAMFPSQITRNGTHEVDEEEQDSTPLLVSSQPSSPAYTSSKTINTTRPASSNAVALSSPFSSSTSSASSASSTSSATVLRSSSPSYSSSSSSPNSPRHPVDKPSRFSRTTWCLIITSALLVVLLASFVLLFPRLALLLTTGSVVYHDYDYYSTPNAARRIYPHLYTADGKYSKDAIEALHEAMCPAPSNRTNAMPVVHVAPAADGITHLHIIVEAESWTLFPWLWDSILVNHTWTDPTLEPTPVLCTPTNNCHRCTDDLSLSPQCHKWFPAERLAVHLLNWPIDRRLIGNITTLLIVGQWYMGSEMFDWLKSDRIAPMLHPNFHLLTMLLMGEECFNWRGDWATLQWKFHPRLAATFTTYGDCHLNPAYHQLQETELPNPRPIDMSQNIVYWPLGPSVEHGFPSRMVKEEQDEHAAERERSLLLNLMVSITLEKSTRMQAWMVTTHYCEQHSDMRCYNHNNDLVWKIINGFDSFTGTSLHTILPIENPTDSQYLPLLTNSTYTLCPAGKNPEQYRIWEALMVGSIPIIEDPSGRWSDEPFIHPAYGTHHRCTRYDVHRVLKKYKAPVLFVDDWRQLDGVLDGLSRDGVVAKRRELKVWFHQLKVELRRELFERVKYLNGRHEGD